jgi:hypothetical protein
MLNGINKRCVKMIKADSGKKAKSRAQGLALLITATSKISGILGDFPATIQAGNHGKDYGSGRWDLKRRELSRLDNSRRERSSR